MPVQINKIEKLVGPKEFINIVSHQRDRISKTEIIQPKLGSNGFGKIKVTFK